MFYQIKASNIFFIKIFFFNNKNQYFYNFPSIEFLGFSKKLLNWTEDDYKF